MLASHWQVRRALKRAQARQRRDRKHSLPSDAELSR
nr:hypothetical protein [Xanthomonas maliensis]